MANFVQLNFKDASTGAAIATIYLTGDECPAGVTRNENTSLISQITAEGRARVFTKPDGIEFRMSVVLEQAETMNKLDLIQTHIANGRIVDVLLLSGVSVWSSTLDAPVYSVSKATITNGVITSFDNAWRRSNVKGQVSRVEVPLVIRQGASTALPLAADWIGN